MHAGSNDGGSTTLRVDGNSPLSNAYLKFDLSGVTGSISSATLRVFAVNGGQAGFDVHGVSDSSWNESAITWSTAPPMGASVGSSGPVGKRQWVSVDVTNAVHGGGPVSLGITTPEASPLVFASREDTSEAPVLVVQTETADTTAPSTPSSLSVGSATQTSLTLSWGASTDNVAVAGYDVYLGTTKVNSSLVTGTSYTFSGLTCGTSYMLGVEAVDASGNVSSAPWPTKSAATSACTTDTTPPSAPTGFVAGTKTQTSIATSWTASTDNPGGVGVAGYNVYVGSTKVNSSLVTGTSYTFSGLACGTTYSLAVEGVDAAGNVSPAPRPTMTTSTSACSDTTPPSAPTGFGASAATQTSIATSWAASTDNPGGVGVAGYNVYVGSTKLNTSLVTATSYTFSGLTCGTSYTLGVEAVDAAGNVSTPRTTMSTSTSACSSSSGYQHVVWVVMENHQYSQIIGNLTSAPYINQLAQTYGSATQMFAESHPSLPNYIAMTSGSTQGITDDSGPSSHLLNVPNIFTQAGSNGRSLEESMTSNCLKGDSGNYAVRHDPAVYYTNYAQCSTQVVPLGATPDLSAGFTFITPNVCHDMHSNSCAGSGDVILQGDQWLQTFIPLLLATPQYRAGNTVIFVTWDEDNTCSGCTNHVPTIVISPTSAGISSATTFNHYSMLRTTEEILGLPLIGGAATATSMRSDFHL